MNSVLHSQGPLLKIRCIFYFHSMAASEDLPFDSKHAAWAESSVTGPCTVALFCWWGDHSAAWWCVVYNFTSWSCKDQWKDYSERLRVSSPCNLSRYLQLSANNTMYLNRKRESLPPSVKHWMSSTTEILMGPLGWAIGWWAMTSWLMTLKTGKVTIMRLLVQAKLLNTCRP